MVGRLVEKQQFGLFQQQFAERHATALAARQLVDRPIVRRAAQGIHRLLDLRIEVPEVLRFDLVLQTGHLVGSLVRIVHRQFVVAIEKRALGRHAFHHVLADILRFVEFRLLRQVADPGALGDPAFAVPIGIDARHDPKQGRFTGAVDAQHTDLGIRVEGQMDIVQDLLAARIGLGEATHMIDELTSHGKTLLKSGRGEWNCVSVSRGGRQEQGEPASRLPCMRPAKATQTSKPSHQPAIHQKVLPRHVSGILGEQKSHGFCQFRRRSHSDPSECGPCGPPSRAGCR